MRGPDTYPKIDACDAKVESKEDVETRKSTAKENR